MSVRKIIECKHQLFEHQKTMNEIYKYAKYTYDISRCVYLPKKKLLIKKIKNENPKNICEYGCGTGKNIIKVKKALNDSECFICAIDISIEMLKLAKKRTGLDSSIHYHNIAAELFTKAMTNKNQCVFDIIYFSYSLSMMSSWKDALQSALENLSPRGKIYILDLYDCEGLPYLIKKIRFLVKKNPWKNIDICAFVRESTTPLKATVKYFYGRYCYFAELSFARE